MGVMRSVPIAFLVIVALQGCAAVSGRTAGETIDDTAITATVKSKLATEQLGTLTRIDVDTTRGVVYLNGVAETDFMRRRAEEVARQVSGVRQVVNNLQVQGTPPGGAAPAASTAPAAPAPAMTDAEITTAVKAKLAADEPSRLVTVGVDTREGTVHLSGTVENEAARARAVELARTIPGVRAVVNELRVPGS
jgi:hyperosmotically inducible protein